MSNETLNIVITAIIIPTVAALIPLFIAFLNQKTQQIKQKVNNEKINAYIDIAEDAVATAVTSVFQTFVDTMKKEGKWNQETATIAFEEAKNKALLIMGDAARDALAQVYGDVNQWINNKIEVYVRTQKECDKI